MAQSDSMIQHAVIRYQRVHGDGATISELENELERVLHGERIDDD